MVDLLSENEGEPSNYPAPPMSMSQDALMLDKAALWSRIESWIAHRWGERSVVWIVEGPGVFVPRLKPATIDTTEQWAGDAWVAGSLSPAPVGYKLDEGTFRVTATVGSADTPPPDVFEAFRRYVEYAADTSEIGIVATSGVRTFGDVSVQSDRPAAWQAKALHNSGAGDLLKRYR